VFDELDYELFWIPYYNASNATNWESLGFDVGCLQPNYAFDLKIDSNRIPNAAHTAKINGMCIEIEIHQSALSDIHYLKKYMDYLSGGVTYGYMNDCIHMYYQAVSIFYSACYSSDPLVRLMYDYTYQFIKGTLDISPDSVGHVYINTSADTAIRGNLNTEYDTLSQYQLAFSSEHGTVALAENGEFVYYPNKGFTGTDTFTYRIGNHLGWSEECKVTVTVG